MTGGSATTLARLGAWADLSSDLFTSDIVGELGPLLAADPDIRIYE